MANFKKKWIFPFFIIFFAFTSAYSQTNQVHNDVTHNLKEGLYYYDLQEYQHAYQYFDNALQFPPLKSQPNLDLIMSEAKYFKAITAFKLNMESALEQLLKVYYQLDDTRRNDVSFYIGKYYFDKKSYADASSWFDQVKGKNLPADEQDDYSFCRAYTNFKSNKINNAKEGFSQLASNPQSKYRNDANYYLGLIYFNEKNYKQAEVHLNLVAKNNQYDDLNVVLAQIHFLNKNYNKVIESLRNQELTPMSQQLLGKSYFELKDYEMSEKYLSDFIDNESKVTQEDMYQLAYSEYKNKKYPQAIEHFKDLQLSDSFGQYAMYALAECYLLTKNKQNALLALMSANSFNQDPVINEESLFNIAKLNFDLKNYNLATRTLDDFIHKYPNSSHIDEAWDLMTNSLLFSNNYPEAISLIEKNPKRIPNSAKLYQEITYTYAVNEFNSGNSSKALVSLDKSLSSIVDKPLQAEAFYLKATIFFQQGNTNAAMAQYNNAYKVVSSNEIRFSQNATLFNIHYGLGYCEYIRKNYNDALLQFKSCIKNYIFSQNEPVSNVMQDVDLRIADILFIQKKYKEAYEQYSKISKGRGQGFDYATLQKANIDGVFKNYTAKISTLQTLIKEVPNSIYFNDAKYQIGLAYEDLNNYEKAKETYNDIINNSNSQDYIPKSLIRLATIYYNNQNTSEALKYYTKIAESYTSSPEADQAMKAIKEIFISQGNPEAYIDYMNKIPNGKQLQVSEQDTIIFEAAEELYANEKYDNALILFNKYLNKFPNGLFSAKAHYYKAEIYVNQKKYDEAVTEYNYLIENDNNPYYELALSRSAYYNYNIQKDYSTSKTLYQKLLKVASKLQNKQVAKLGLVESNYELKNYASVIELAGLIQKDPEMNAESKLNALYYNAMSYYHLKNYDKAIPLLSKLSEDKTSIRSAECTYYLALIKHKQTNYKASNEILFKAKDDYGSYQNWVVRYFVLIGYNYHKLGDDFQAKATLESIINNYSGDDAIVKDAKEKLAEVNNSIKSNTKVSYE